MRKFDEDATEVVQWREIKPNVIFTPRASTANVVHAVPRNEGRAVCGLKPKFGWQMRIGATKHCARCDQVLAAKEGRKAGSVRVE